MVKNKFGGFHVMLTIFSPRRVSEGESSWCFSDVCPVECGFTGLTTWKSSQRADILKLII